MTKSTPTTSTEGWLREYSRGLENSFRSSDPFKHLVTKGQSREHQILDALSKLLPTRVSVETNIVILDSADEQSPKFDGCLVDRSLWPRIFEDGATAVVMIESVLAALEIKSRLDNSELDDIFKKANKLRSMTSSTRRPLITGFAYECPNANLSFFDFVVRFHKSPEGSPSWICILNKHVFALARQVGKILEPENEPNPRLIPILYSPGVDALLVYIYFLSEWITVGTVAASAYARYSRNVFSKMTAFHFENDFIDQVMSSERKFGTARKSFLRKTAADINGVYQDARKALNLPSTA